LNLLFAILASIFISLISLIGIFSLLLNEKKLNSLLVLLVGLSAGALIGASFLHILPEAVSSSKNQTSVFFLVVISFIFFFFLEKYLFWRHCHRGHECNIHTFVYLNLFGDGIHNFIDGLIIGTTFLIDIKLGLITTLAIVLHEVPQELGDFGVLVYGGFSKYKALFYNFISSLLCFLGVILGYCFANKVTGFIDILLPIAGGSFIYIASCDLIPELHKEPGLKTIFSFITGILLMFLLSLYHCSH